MIETLIYVISFFIATPLAATILIYGVSKAIQGNPWKAVHHSVNWSTMLYLIAVPLLLKMIAGYSLIGPMVLVILLIMATLIIYQWKYSQDINFIKAVKILWKILFLLLLIAYILLVLIGIIQKIFF